MIENISKLKQTKGQNENKKYHNSVRQNILAIEFQILKEHKKREKDKKSKIYFVFILNRS